MTINDIPAVAYAILLIDSLLIAWLFYRTKDGKARIALIVHFLMFAALMASLGTAYLLRWNGASEYALDCCRLATRWIAMLYAPMMTWVVWVMLRGRMVQR